MAPLLTGIPPHIQQFISQLMGPEPDDPFENDLAALHQQVLAAQGAAQGAQGPLAALRRQPMPQTSPGTDALTELLGGLSQVLAPELGGLQQARTARAGMQDDMQKRRTERLSQREKNADELADRAKQLGNLELEMKWRSKAEGFRSKQERAKQSADMAVRLTEGAADRQGSMDRTRVQEAGATERTRIGADATINKILAQNPGLTLGPDGNVVPLEGIDDNDFTRELAPILQTYANAKGSKKNDVLPELKAVFSRKMRSEAFNPAAYVTRLKNSAGAPKLGAVGKLLGLPQGRYTYAEIAQHTANNYKVDVLAAGGPRQLINMLKLGGMPEQAAVDAVETYIRSME